MRKYAADLIQRQAGDDQEIGNCFFRQQHSRRAEKTFAFIAGIPVVQADLREIMTVHINYALQQLETALMWYKKIGSLFLQGVEKKEKEGKARARTELR